MMFEPRCFVAVTLSGPVLEALGRLQRKLQGAASDAAKVELIPRRYLHVTLDDLGRCPPGSDEAVSLAIERLLPKHGPFTVRFGGVEAFPSNDQPRLVYARIQDDKGRLVALREALHAALERYGFDVDPRPFQPHVALARVSGFGALPRVAARDVPDLRVRQISLYRQTPPEKRGPRYHRAWSTALVRFPASPAKPPPDSQIIDEITRQLDERLAHHAPTKPRARRRRAAIEAEED